MNICDCVAPEHVELDAQAPSKTRLLQALARKAAAAIGADEKTVLVALEDREQLGSTGIGSGIAVPHASLPELTRPFGLVMRLGKPVDFDSIDGAAVDIVCLVLTPTNGTATHLTLLSRVARLLRAPEAVARIRSAATADEVREVLRGMGD